MHRRTAALAAVLLAAGCAPAPPRVAEQVALEALHAREARLTGIDQWAFSGRLAVADGRDSGSGRIDWVQDGERLEVSLSAPVSRQSWRLTADRRGALLEGLDEGPVQGADAQHLLARTVGWNVPFAALGDWVRGARSDRRAAVSFGPAGLPDQLVEDGWVVEFRDWYGDRPLPLPRRLFASRGDLRVRLVIDRWEGFDTPLAGAAR